MIKKEFVERFSEVTGENKKRSKYLVEEFLDLTGEMLKEDDKLRFVGFGGFEVHSTPARRVKHPKTSEIITIPEKKVVKFRIGKNLKKSVIDSSKKDIEDDKFSTKRIFKKISNIFTAKN